MKFSLRLNNDLSDRVSDSGKVQEVAFCFIIGPHMLCLNSLLPYRMSSLRKAYPVTLRLLSPTAFEQRSKK